jgi:hypothetical protein
MDEREALRQLAQDWAVMRRVLVGAVFAGWALFVLSVVGVVGLLIGLMVGMAMGQ